MTGLSRMTRSLGVDDSWIGGGWEGSMEDCEVTVLFI